MDVSADRQGEVAAASKQRCVANEMGRRGCDVAPDCASRECR